MDRMDFVMDGSDGYGFHGSNCHPYPKAKTKKSELHYKNQNYRSNKTRKLIKKSVQMLHNQFDRLLLLPQQQPSLIPQSGIDYIDQTKPFLSNSLISKSFFNSFSRSSSSDLNIVHLIQPPYYRVHMSSLYMPKMHMYSLVYLIPNIFFTIHVISTLSIMLSFLILSRPV